MRAATGVPGENRRRAEPGSCCADQAEGGPVGITQNPGPLTGAPNSAVGRHGCVGPFYGRVTIWFVSRRGYHLYAALRLPWSST